MLIIDFYLTCSNFVVKENIALLFVFAHLTKNKIKKLLVDLYFVHDFNLSEIIEGWLVYLYFDKPQLQHQHNLYVSVSET